MNWLRRAIPLSLSIALVAPAQRANAQEALRLDTDPINQELVVHSLTRTTSLLIVGPRADQPIPIFGITLDVFPEFVLPLGTMEPGDSVRLFVPRLLSHLYAEAVAYVEETGTLQDSNYVELMGAFTDMVDATFRAVLVSTDSIPPFFTVGASLTAPTSGYELVLDGFELAGSTMNVYLRLVEPGPGEIVLQVLTPHEIAVDLGNDVGSAVHVHLMRVPRGVVVPEVYKRMAVLPVLESKS